MAYNRPGYNDYPQQPGYDNSYHPPTASYHQDPFASRSSFDYPPQNSDRPYSGESGLGKSGSQWSLEEPAPLVAGGAGYSAVQRDSSNPYSKEYRGGNDAPKGGNKVRKWALIVAAVLIVLGLVDMSAFLPSLFRREERRSLSRLSSRC